MTAQEGTGRDLATPLRSRRPTADGPHAARGEKSKARSRDGSSERIGSASQRAADGSPSPDRMKGGDGWTAHAAQSMSRL